MPISADPEGRSVVPPGAPAKAIDVLLVEDNPLDIHLTREALRMGRVCNRLFTVGDGVEALSFLHRRDAYHDAPRPDLILLDLNLPGKDGRQLLAELRADEELKHIPVVVVSGSLAEADVMAAYELDAACYISKPLHPDDFLDAVRSVAGLWLSVVKAPGAG